MSCYLSSKILELSSTSLLQIQSTTTSTNRSTAGASEMGRFTVAAALFVAAA
uniref:Uncharacterized protein n=1 Tax=Oryza brachyantha TaxID=4533 RepID=J3M7I9_ORYBR